MNHLRAARLKLPLIADLDVLIMIIAGAQPLEVVAGVAELDVTPTGPFASVFELNHVIMDIRAGCQIGEAGLIGLLQFGVTLVGRLPIVTNDSKGAVGGEQLDQTVDIAAPDATAIALGQVTYL